MKPERREFLAFAQLVLVMILWTGNSIVARALRDDIPPFTLAFGRWTGASLIVLPFALATLRREWPEIRAAWKPLLFFGLIGIGAFNAFFYSGLQYTTASNALLLQAAIPALVLLLDRLLFGTTSSPLQKAGVLVSALGVLVIVFRGDIHAALGLRLGFGDLLIMIGVLVWSIYTVLIPRRPKISALGFIATTFVIGAVAMAPFAAEEWSRGYVIHWKPAAIGGLAYVAVLPSLVAYSLFNSATETLGPGRAGQMISLQPIFGALLSALLLGEALHPYHLAGIAIIIAGIAIGIAALRAKSATGAA